MECSIVEQEESNIHRRVGTKLVCKCNLVQELQIKSRQKLIFIRKLQEFQDSITELREHEVTARTMDTARAMADEAIAELDGVPEGIVKDALIRFAHQVVKRSY